MSSITPDRASLTPSSSTESLSESLSESPAASEKPTVKIETPEGGPMSVLVTVNGETFRLTKVSLGNKEIDLNSIELKDFADKVGKLAKKLIIETDIAKGQKAFNVSVERPASKEKHDEDVIFEEDDAPSVEDKPSKPSSISVRVSGKSEAKDISKAKTIELFEEVDKRTHHIIKGREGVHTVSKEFKDTTSSKTTQFIRKQAFRLGAIVSAPVVLPVMTVIGAGMLVKAGVDKLRGKGAIREATVTMQEGEERAKADAWGSKGSGLNYKLTTKEDLRSYLSDEVGANTENCVNTKLTNRLEAALDRAGYDDDEIEKIFEELEDLVLTPEQFKDAAALEKTLHDIFKNTDVMQSISRKEIREIVDECQLFRLEPNALEEQIASDAQKWESFITLVQKDKTEITDPKKHNLEVLKKFRAVLSSPTYQAFKDDPYNEYVIKIHQFAIANYNEVMALDPYHELGKVLQQDEKGDIPAAGDLSEVAGRQEFVDRLVAGHERATSENLTDHDFKGLAKLPYGILNPLQALGAIASLSTKGEWGQNLSEAFGQGGYDPAGVSNNPSLQGTTISEVVLADGTQAEIKINNCYGGSPTVGHQIAPEFVAVLQGIRNNNNLRKYDKERLDPNIPSVLTYTNLQKIHANGGEGERSFAIMQLQARFGKEFVGVSLSKDSDFYLLKGKYATDNAHNQWKGPEVFGTQMLDLLSEDACYTYLDRRGKEAGGGIYLPGGKEAWKPVLPKIIGLANQIFADSQLDQGSNDLNVVRENRFAYQELVYSLIEAYVEEKAGINAPGHFVMAIRACKENIDRGGGENAKYMYSLLGEKNDEERLTLVSGVLESRALASRDRVLIHGRMPPILAFMKHVSPEQIQAGIQSLFNTVLGVAGVAKHEYTPAVLPSEELPESVRLPASDDEMHTDETVLNGLTFSFERVTTPVTSAPPLQVAPDTMREEMVIPIPSQKMWPSPPSSIEVEKFGEDPDEDFEVDFDDGMGVVPPGERMRELEQSEVGGSSGVTDIDAPMLVDAAPPSEHDEGSLASISERIEESPVSLGDLPTPPQTQSKREGFLGLVSSVVQSTTKLFSPKKDWSRELRLLDAMPVEDGGLMRPTDLHVVEIDGVPHLEQQGEGSLRLYQRKVEAKEALGFLDNNAEWQEVGKYFIKNTDVYKFKQFVIEEELKHEKLIEEEERKRKVAADNEFPDPYSVAAASSSSVRSSLTASYGNCYVKFEATSAEMMYTKFKGTAKLYSDEACTNLLAEGSVRLRKQESKKIAQPIREGYVQVGIYYVNKKKLDHLVTQANEKRNQINSR